MALLYYKKQNKQTARVLLPVIEIGPITSTYTSMFAANTFKDWLYT